MTHDIANLAEPRAASGAAAWGATLYDAHPHAVLVIDATGRLLHANRAAQWLTGGGRLRSLFDLLELDATGQQVTLRLPPRAVTLEGDAVRLAQMFSGLLANASKFSPDAAAIEIGVDVAGGSVRVSVKDSGRGISAAFLPRAFDLFAQETRERKGGLGIGLTLARRIAQYHAGEVEAHSGGPGAGSEFVVTLPLATPARDRSLARRSGVGR